VGREIGQVKPRIPGKHLDIFLVRFPAEIAVNKIGLDKAGQLCFFIRDVTVRKRAQDALEDAFRRLEEHDRAKSQFVSNVSHELRTPLTSMTYAVANMLNGVCGPITDRIRKYLELLDGDCKRLLGTVNDILDLRKIEMKTFKLAKARVPFFRLVNRSSESLRVQADQRNVKLTIQSAAGAWFVDCDAQKFERVMVNVVGNAVKFTEQGFIRLAARIENKDRDECLLFFEVEDTGPGIDDAYKDRMFDPFSQQDASINRKYGGTGLGLAISRHLARLMDGDVEVYNKKPHGSVFKVVLRLKKNSSGSFEALTGEEKKEKISDLIERISQLGLKILLAEDHPVNQRVILLMLKKMNLSATVVANGEEVLRMIREKAFDLILMDVRMPVLNGIETTKIIRAPESDIKTKNIPIIALTALAMQEDAEKCLKAGMDRFLTKPIHPDKIVYAIADLFKV